MPLNFTTLLNRLRGVFNKSMFFHKTFVVYVVCPMAIMMFYYIFVASDRYVSESKITVKQSNLDSEMKVSPLSFLIGGNPLSREDAFYLTDYIYSMDMLDYLDKNMMLRAVYEDGKADIFSRLWKSSSREDFLDYFRNHVAVVFDELSSIITIRAEGFTPETARKINVLILRQSEKFINEMSQKIAAEQLIFVDGELKRVNKEMQKAKNDLINFQNKNNVLDPVEQARATSGIITTLEGNLAALEAELNGMLTYLQDGAPQVLTMKGKIAALQQQIAKEKAVIAGEGSGQLNRLAAQFMDVRQAVEFNVDVYKATLAALEKSRLDAAKKIKSVVIIATPNLPDEAEYPRKLYILTTAFIIATIVYGIARLIIAMIREHREDAF